METLESSRVCRLCGKQSGISINIFDKNESHAKKINAILPIVVHEMDLLPKHMCHRCSYKLEEFHKFYMDCLKTDADLKSQLSWMRKEDANERIDVPMVHIENVKIKVEPPDYDLYDTVDDVDYINSMNPTTFPVNGVQSNDITEGIAYTTYARCNCYCDKADQSNETVCTKYDSMNNRIARCNRVNDIRSINENDVSTDKLQAVKRNFLADKTYEKQSNLGTFVNETGPTEKTRLDRATTRNFRRIENAKDVRTSIREVSKSSTVVRNLRPRRRSIHYKETRNKSTPTTGFPVTQIKVEKLDDLKGRILRPRKKTIDYFDKRRYSKHVDGYRRLQEERHRVRNIANKLKLPTLLQDTIKLTIKREQLSSDTEDTTLLHESVSIRLPNDREETSIGELSNRGDSLARNYITNVQNDRINHSTLNVAQRDDNRLVSNRWKPIDNLGKIDLNRVAVKNHPSKCLRSSYSRNGKIDKLEQVELSTKKLRRNLRHVADGVKNVGRNLMKTVRGISTVQKMSASLIDNIKHYCDECNTSFFNRELFKLHPCYH